MPRRLEPMLAILADLPANESQWAFEFKWDGVRALAYHQPARAARRSANSAWLIESRNQLDVTPRYPELDQLRDALSRRSVLLDGEIIAVDEQSRPSFARLQRRMHVNGAARIAALVRQIPICYVLFDLLYLDGRLLIDLPYVKRRALLEETIPVGPSWQITPSHVGRGRAMLDAAREHAMEGVVAKRLDSTYTPGRRSPNWLKIKLVKRQEFVIGGWTGESTGITGRIGTMLIGYHDNEGQLHYAGHVGTGLSAADHPVLMREFKKLAKSSSPFVEKLPRSRRGGMTIHYLDPRLVVEIEYRRWPADGLVQQASFKGLREDKPAGDVIRERNVKT